MKTVKTLLVAALTFVSVASAVANHGMNDHDNDRSSMRHGRHETSHDNRRHAGMKHQIMDND